MRVSARGFGGVIFGNEIHADPAQPKPVLVTFVKRADDSQTPTPDGQVWGHLQFEFADKSTGFSVPVREQHAIASCRLISDKSGAHQGEGIGLVGFEGRTLLGKVENGQVKTEVIGYSFYVHPAVEKLQLSRALMVVDSSHFKSNKQNVAQILRAKINDTGDAAALNAFDRWLTGSWGNYKFVDRPLRIMRAKTGLVSAKAVSSGTKASSQPDDDIFIDFSPVVAPRRNETEQQISSRREAQRRESAPLTSLMLHSLVRVSEDFRELNDFAEVLALYRYVAAAAGRCSSSDVVTKNERKTPYGSLFVEKTGKLIFGPPDIVMRTAMLESVKTAANSIVAGKAASLRQLNQNTYKWYQRELADDIATRLVDNTVYRVAPESRMANFFNFTEDAKDSKEENPLGKPPSELFSQLLEPEAGAIYKRENERLSKERQERMFVLFSLGTTEAKSSAKERAFFTEKEIDSYLSASRTAKLAGEKAWDKHLSASDEDARFEAWQKAEAVSDRIRRALAKKVDAAHASQVEELDRRMGVAHLQSVVQKLQELWLSFELAGVSLSD